MIYLCTVYFIFTYSFISTTINNPGIPAPIDPKITYDNLPREADGIQYCKLCNLYSYKLKQRRKSALHCSTCGLCIECN